MIPLHLKISGFLSYRDPVEVDFTLFNLACIAGPNGAGKSSLLDAVTWCLFGQARKRDDSVINLQSKSAEVSLVFAYEGNVYRVQRIKPRDKTGMLEFHILQNHDEWTGGSGVYVFPAGFPGIRPMKWKPLTEHTLRETETCIEKTLRLDYETFVNASFFLQGKADQFTQQRPGDRKRILSSILGLEIWETYRQAAVDRRKAVENDMAILDGKIAEIQAELSEEETRKSQLEKLEGELERLTQARIAQESVLDSIRKVVATLAEQRKLVDALARQCETAVRRLDELEAKQAARREEEQIHTGILTRAEKIEAAYSAWQQSRIELEGWEKIAVQFREQEKRRQKPLDEINTARTRLEVQLNALLDQKSAIESAQAEMPALRNQLEVSQVARHEDEDRLAERSRLEEELKGARQRQSDARAENPRLKGEMDELKERIRRVAQVEGAVCPICGKPLSAEERQALVDELNQKGRELGDRYRANQTLMQQSDKVVYELETGIRKLTEAEASLRVHTRTCDQITDRLETIQRMVIDWESNDIPRLAEIQGCLSGESFAPEARIKLAEIDAELKVIGYDAAAHDLTRRLEMDGRVWEGEVRALEKARAALGPLMRELSEIGTQIEAQRVDVDRQRDEYDRAASALAAAMASAPDLDEAERQSLRLKEQENIMRIEVGGARQKVLILDDLKARLKVYNAEREQKARQAGYYKQLERAFGKDGVPSLLIEQALPQIEAKANEILDRLTGGNMSVRFVTQAAYKDKRREDLKETLDIQISDGAGTRDYEMFSGGEAFRVNFAIRLALSEVLAQRAGARLQTLVIDEGFGSQDVEGRQRLLEAINMVSQDFAKILVITHIDELKDAFPNRVEVEKTPRGSIVRVI